MIKVDVSDYYKNAADNIGTVIKLIRDGTMEGSDRFCKHYAIEQSLNTHEFLGTLEYIAAVSGLQEGDSFNDVVSRLALRHLQRNQLQELWLAFRLLPESSTTRQRMVSLLKKTKGVADADLKAM